jgi:D-alanyl-D-alanine carboxypeptidase/D-alanyl-D-alanine-endopeptidase (penicillin-binding protein 4)
MRRGLVGFIASILIVCLPTSALARAPWKRDIDRLAGGHSMGIAVRDEGLTLYRHESKIKKAPASNEKLLMSMALLDELPIDTEIRTTAAVGSISMGVVDGDLWVLGHGDPTITGGGQYGRSLPFDPTTLGSLSRAIRAAGVTEITGSVVGNTGYFARDWFAPGWKAGFPMEECPLPSSLTFEGNIHRGDHVVDPELRAARSLTRKLIAMGVDVNGEPAAAQSPGSLTVIASVGSEPLEKLLRYMNHKSANFFAEVLGKRLAVQRYGPPGTISNGARAIEAWAGAHGVSLIAHDSSGLSYDNRVSPGGLARLIGASEAFEWGEQLRDLLPGPGEGTLEDRLNGVKVHAKTGTLDGVSALSGWVWLRQTKSWAEFSILSRGMPKTTAAGIEDQVVRILTRDAS